MECTPSMLTGYRRGGPSNGSHKNHISLMSIEGVHSIEDTHFYAGKKVAYIYKAKKQTNGTRYRVIWGKVVRSHGSKGGVRAVFRKPLPPQSLGAPARVMLYPSRI